MDTDPEQRPNIHKGLSTTKFNSLTWSNALLKKTELSFPRNFLPLKVFVNNSKKVRTELVETYINKMDSYLANRKNRTLNQYIGCLDRFFGGCSLTQKELAVDALKHTLLSKMDPKELERIHGKALNQGNLSKLYSEIKTTFMINVNVEPYISHRCR